MKWITLVCTALVLLCSVVPAFSGEHSLYYTYTALSHPVNLPGIYEFTALGVLDDQELDYYNSETQVKVPKQTWMKKNMEPDYWDKGTQSRKSKEQWFKVNVDILIDRMRHNKSDLHVLQWRHGCVINDIDGSVKFLRGVDEYSYDGSEFLSFDEINSRWIAPVPAAVSTKMKWDGVDILNQYTKGYLEKECVGWLTKFLGFRTVELKQLSPPDLHTFLKKSVTHRDRLTLTCLATGFYPPDIELQLRKSRTSLPEHMLTSSGVRPNGDGTYQLRKSVDINEEDKELYDCYVNHTSLREPIVSHCSKATPCLDCTGPVIQSSIIGAVTGALFTMAVVGCVLFILTRKGIITSRCTSAGSHSTSPGQGNSGSAQNNHVNVPMLHADKMDQKSASDSGQVSRNSSPQGSSESVNENNKMLNTDGPV